MNVEFYKSSFEKLINSDLLKNIYPMIDHIDITSFRDNPNFIAYDMSVNIYLNDPTIHKNNMYEKEFDPHYLVEHHMKHLANYLSIQLVKIGFKLFGPDGELLLNWENK
jgi:hypothetical protein